MDILLVFSVISALMIGLMWVLALAKPTAVYDFIGLIANGPRSISEIQTIFGGLLIALGIVPIFIGPVPGQMFGIN